MSLWHEPEYTPSKVEPTLDDAIRVTAADERWTLGDAVKIMDANTSESDFIVTHVFIEYCDVWEYFWQEL